MFLGLILAALGVLNVGAREHAFDPRLWGESGVLVSDHDEGQYCPSVASAGDLTVVAWQDDRGADPDIAFALLDTDGEVVRERVFVRPGVQTRPVIAGRWLVFVESMNGADWSIVSVQLSDFVTGSDSLVVIADTPGAKPEVVCDVTTDGDLIVAWVSDHESGGRALTGAILGSRGDRLPILFPIVNTVGTVMDFHIAVNANLVFFTWTDWSGTQPTIVSQCVDLESRDRTFGPYGLALAPAGEWAWHSRVNPSDQGYGAFTWVERTDAGLSRVVAQIVGYDANYRFFSPRPLTPWMTVFHEYDSAPFLDGGVVAAWSTRDQQDESIIAASAMDFAGKGLWESFVASLSSRVDKLSIVSDAATSWITWSDERFGDADIFAARLASNGEPQWLTDGACVAQANGGQWNPIVSKTNNDHLIVSWIDEREAETPRIGLQMMK